MHFLIVKNAFRTKRTPQPQQTLYPNTLPLNLLGSETFKTRFLSQEADRHFSLIKLNKSSNLDVVEGGCGQFGGSYSGQVLVPGILDDVASVDRRL